MIHSTTCSWCHTVNDAQQRWCKTCGHSALHPREECDCRACLGVLFVEDATTTRTAASKPPATATKTATSTKPKRTRK